MDSVLRWGGDCVCVCQLLIEIKPMERMCLHSEHGRDAYGAREIHCVCQSLSNIESQFAGYKERTMGSVFARQRDIARDKCVCLVHGVYVTERYMHAK